MAKMNYERLRRRELGLRGVPVNSDYSDLDKNQTQKITSQTLWCWGQKYRNKPLREIPSGYLIWVINNFSQPDHTAIRYARKELTKRRKRRVKNSRA